MKPRRGTLSRVALVLGLVLSALALLAPATNAAADDPRLFPETGFRIGHDGFWSYYGSRGGIDSFGLPLSREFTLQGTQVQVFQRAVLEQAADGSVQVMNLLDSTVFPYTHVNGATFPAADPALAAAAPTPDQPDYDRRIVEFIRANAPNVWDEQPVAFYDTFFATVTCADAFPRGGCQSGLLSLFDLEVWGVPMSEPALDPNNHDFIYLRFQRGIMHYSVACQCTHGLLLGDSFRALLTGDTLPEDLEADARADRSPYLRQYDPTQPFSLARPAELPATDLTDAFTPDTEPQIEP